MRMIPILMYHQVAEIPRRLDPLGLAVPPDQFLDQMSYLARRSYRCLSLAEAVDYLCRDGRTPERSVVITFDDGYQSVFSHACPILEKFGFTASIFLVAGRMGGKSNWEGQDEARAELLMSDEEARDLARRGFTLGSHTFSHPRLTQLSDEAAFEEIMGSRLLLQDVLGQPVAFFSYPYSDVDARLEGMVEKAGYTAACGGYYGPCSTFNLWRIPCLRDETALSFTLKVNGGYTQWTALHESAPGRILRQSVHSLRKRLTLRRPRQPVVLSHGSEREIERGP